ncbi:hypothetical protein KHP60_15995 [Microvirga sp. 3-52]|uniref:hypothetical protein n=1 Tax=Microvirga sp. 3-52 TaxID=2792425 RepID=UPI001AD4FE34|nr:hypothetical protein [Microvirga sp. 3-52]MBO1906570.1 hypothetical protein [Microvirga sp. 3-52]MBS7453833.1 hypothetical protein [Microvirga sp. 3-52]
MAEIHDDDLIVHTVHGTWPYGFVRHVGRRIFGSRASSRNKPSWFEEGSGFCKDIIGQVNSPIVWVPFSWSGNNSFLSRRTAAIELAERLRLWFRERPNARHIVIAHSHGGTVAISACNILANSDDPLPEIITLATPFTRIFIADDPIFVMVARYMLLQYGPIAVALFTAIWVYIHHSAETTLLTSFLLSFLFFWIVAIVVYLPIIIIGMYRKNYIKKLRYTDSLSIKRALPIQKYNLLALRGTFDEASLSIATSQFLLFVSETVIMRGIVSPFYKVGIYYRSIKRRHFGKRAKLIIIGIIAILLLPNVLQNINNIYDFYKNYTDISVDISSHSSIPVIESAVLFILAIFNYIIYWGILLADVGGIIFAAYCAILLVGAALLLPAQIVLAIAVGSEVLKTAGLGIVESEPIPSGVSGRLMTISATEAEKASGIHLTKESACTIRVVAQFLKRRPRDAISSPEVITTISGSFSGISRNAGG